jgi:hypothetical protein
VENRPWHRRQKGESPNRCDRTDINIIALARRIGLSMMELDTLTMQDFFDLVYAYMGDDPDEPREATQDDIDAFYRM